MARAAPCGSLAQRKASFSFAPRSTLPLVNFTPTISSARASRKYLETLPALPAPAVLAPENPAALTPDANANRTPFPFLHVPLFLKGKPFGVLQVWLKPYVQQNSYAEFVAFLASLAVYVEQHLQ